MDFDFDIDPVDVTKPVEDDACLNTLERELLSDRERRERFFFPFDADAATQQSNQSAESLRNDEIRSFLSRPHETTAAASQSAARSETDPRVYRFVTDVDGTPWSVTSAMTGDRVYITPSPRNRENDLACLERVSKPPVKFSVDQIRQKMEEASIQTPPPSPRVPRGEALLYHEGCLQVATEGRRELWTLKYAPKTFLGLITDDRVNREVMKWLKGWREAAGNSKRHSLIKTPESNKAKPRLGSAKSPSSAKITDFFTSRSHSAEAQTPTKPAVVVSPPDRQVLILCGPVGSGKTTLVKIAAQMCGYRPFFIDASDDRSPDAVNALLHSVLQSKSVFGEKHKSCVVFDEIDTLPPGPEARQTVQKIVDWIHGDPKKGIKLRRPMVFICQSPHSAYLAPLRPLAKTLYLPQPRINAALVGRLQKICVAEGIDLDRRVLHQLTEQTRNDISASLNALQFQRRPDGSSQLSLKQLQASPFQIWESILTPTVQKRDFEELLTQYESFGDYELILKGVLWNYTQIHLQDGQFQKRRSMARWLSEMSQYVWRLPNHCPVLFCAMRRLALCSDRSVKMEWPKAEFDASRQSYLSQDALNRFLTELTPKGFGLQEREALVLDVVPYAAVVTQTGMPTLNVRHALTGECRLKLFETMRRPDERVAEREGAVAVKRKADVYDSGMKKIRR